MAPTSLPLPGTSRLLVTDCRHYPPASNHGLSRAEGAIFKRETGLGVVTYRPRLRMALAMETLDTSDDPISAIAHSVGSPDAFYFSRSFRMVDQIR